MARVEVLDEHVGHAGVAGQGAEELPERLQAAGRGADADDRERRRESGGRAPPRALVRRAREGEKGTSRVECWTLGCPSDEGRSASAVAYRESVRDAAEGVRRAWR